MSRTLLLALAASAVASSCWAQTTTPADPSAAGPTAEHEPYVIACEVMGRDLVLYNRGAGPIPVGTLVKWSVRIGGKQGEYRLEEELVPFVGYYVSGALAPSYLWDRACVAEILPEGTQPAAAQ